MTGACFTAPMMSWEDRCAAIVGTWVADARRLARFSQDALGGRVGVSQSTISRVERGLVPGATLRTIAPILVFLEVELAETIRLESSKRRLATLGDAASRMADE
jgi:transcriptional regulator with XRE-family HTH domain